MFFCSRRTCPSAVTAVLLQRLQKDACTSVLLQQKNMFFCCRRTCSSAAEGHLYTTEGHIFFYCRSQQICLFLIFSVVQRSTTLYRKKYVSKNHLGILCKMSTFVCVCVSYYEWMFLNLHTSQSVLTPFCLLTIIL